MSLKTEMRVIAGQPVTVTQMPGRLALKTSARLAGHLGAMAAKLPEGKAIGINGGLAQFLDVDVRDVGSAFVALAERLSDEEIDLLSGRLLDSAKIEIGTGAEVPVLKAMDAGLIEGGLGAIYQILGFALEVNFAGFGGGLAGNASANPAGPA